MNLLSIALITMLTVSCQEDPLDKYKQNAGYVNETVVTYYVDATAGDDLNDGKSAETALKTIYRVNQLKLEPGDMLFFKRGEVFEGELEIQAEGTKKQPIVIDAYGEAEAKPVIKGNESSMYAAHIYNSTYLTFQNLEIVNKGTELAGRCGLALDLLEYGISKNITLRNLTVRDVTSTTRKMDYGGAIKLSNKGTTRRSRYENLLIEDCHIIDCRRNAIFWAGSGETYCDRKNWYPNKNVIIRNNLIEGVPGDGILPMACDGVTIEYNVMRDCCFLPDKSAAAGIWPWSCDNVTIQFNDVSGHQADADGQAFDSDYNCRNTVIQYNYSHDNYGGFLLVCDDPSASYINSVGILNTKVCYNISINDGVNPRKNIEPAVIQFYGNPIGTDINHNIIHVSPNQTSGKAHRMLRYDSKVKAVNTNFDNNVFYSPVQSEFVVRDVPTTFSDNWFIGDYKNRPSDSGMKTSSKYYQETVVDVDPEGYQALYLLMDKKVVGGKEHYFVNKDKIEAFFAGMNN